MDKLASVFVIAPSSVVIATGGVWLYRQYSAYQSMEECIAREVELHDDTSNHPVFDKEYTDMSKTEKREFVRSICAHKLRSDGVLNE
jgi:hypothetical protein